MATANELAIDTGAGGLAMAEAIFGPGVTIVSASHSGDAAASGIYSGAQGTIPGVVPSDGGVILSTGAAADFTNDSGTSDTNTATGTGTDTAGVDGDAGLDALAGQGTFDGAILDVTFIPEGDYLTMQFVFTSEEYFELVGSGGSDVFGLWVNGQFVEATITAGGTVTSGTVNPAATPNLFRDNAADQFNTEMDGLTHVLSFKAPVNPGEANTLRIGIADGGDAGLDSSLLIPAGSVQTVTLAFDDSVQLVQGGSRVVDVLANDRDLHETGLTVTEVMGQPITAGQTVTLATGEQVTLNPDGTLTITADGDTGASVLTYTIADGAGNTDTGHLTITTLAAPALDGIVEGTAAGEMIDAAWTGDPDGDRVDNGDATGTHGTTGEGDYILAGGGDDTVLAGAGDDSVFAGEGDDSIDGGAGNDALDAGAGNDTVDAGAGDDSAYLGAGDDIHLEGDGNDSVFGGSGDDAISGGAGDDLIAGGAGADTLLGGDGADVFTLLDGDGLDSIDGGEGGPVDHDALWFASYTAAGGLSVTFSGDGAGDYGWFDTAAAGSFTGIEEIRLGEGADSLDAQATFDGVLVAGGAGDDSLSGGAGADSIDGGAGNDLIFGNGGADSLAGGEGNDTIDAGPDYALPPEFTLVEGAAQGLTGTNGNPDFDHAASSSGPGLDSGTVMLDGGFPMTGYHVGNGADANETHSHAFTQPVAGVTLTLAGIDPDEVVILWLDGVALDLEAAVAEGRVSFDPGTTGFVIDGAGALAATEPPVTEPIPAVLTILGPFTTLAVENASATGEGGGTVYTLEVDTNSPASLLPDDDTVDAGAGDDVVTAGAGHDLLMGGEGNDTLDGRLGDDSLAGEAGDDSLVGGEGNDTLSGGAGNDSLDAGEDDDSLAGEAGDDSLAGGGGTDTLEGGEGTDTLAGGEGDDLLTDLDGSGLLTGDLGNDTLASGAGDDNLAGGEGDDSLSAGGGNDSADGGLGADTILGGAGNDTLSGGADVQIPNGAPPEWAVLSGTSGSVAGTGGNGSIDHAAGSDTGSVLEAQADISDPQGGTLQMTGYQVGDGSQTSETHSHAFTSEVGSVQLRITGLNTVETLVFTLDGQPLDLGEALGLGLAEFDAGTTSYYIDASGNLASASDVPGPFVPAVLTLHGPLSLLTVTNLSADGSGDGTLYELSLDTTPAWETIPDGADLLDGGEGADSIAGGAGDDTITGGGDGDGLSGGAGNDSIEGNAGNDTLDGGAGDDTLEGGDGRDLIRGGIGDVVDGGSGGDDRDTLDLRGYTLGAVNVLYDTGVPENGTVEFLDADGNLAGTLTFADIEKVKVPCFTAGTLIATDLGERRVEELRPGDRVLTRDHGYREIRWAGRRDLTAAELAAAPQCCPVRIGRGALGLNLPARDLTVSPQHRVLICGSRAEILFGEHEVLVAALHLAGQAGVHQLPPGAGAAYVHLLFDRHEIIRANGAWSESYQPGETTLAAMEAGPRAEVLALFPELASGVPFAAARVTLKRHEVRLLLSA